MVTPQSPTSISETFRTWKHHLQDPLITLCASSTLEIVRQCGSGKCHMTIYRLLILQ